MNTEEWYKLAAVLTNQGNKMNLIQISSPGRRLLQLANSYLGFTCPSEYPPLSPEVAA